MERTDALHLLQTLIDYFGAGNLQTDSVAKVIIESDFEYLDQWQTEIKRLKDGGEWTGLRAPEAEVVVNTLSTLRKMLDELSC